jgi:hypothetical protein
MLFGCAGTIGFSIFCTVALRGVVSAAMTLSRFNFLPLVSYTSSDHISFIPSNLEASFRHVETASGRDNVRYPRRFGEHVLRSSFTALDPERTSMTARETTQARQSVGGPTCAQTKITEPTYILTIARLIATDPV